MGSGEPRFINPEPPPIDLHRHLEGSARIDTVLELAREHRRPLPARTPEGLRPHVQVTEPLPDLRAFLAKNEIVASVLVNYEACRRLAYECVEDAGREGIAYLELRFSPFFLTRRHGYDPVGLIEAVADGARSGERDHGVRTNLIGVLRRNSGPEGSWPELEALLARRDLIVALDLAGDEQRWPARLFSEHFRRAREEAGWRVTVHAGEAAGPESVWGAIRDLGAERIGHATHAIEDPHLMDFMVDKRIGIESNLTSNVQTSAVPGYDNHPLRSFLKRGLWATICTDDPTTSGITLAHEYEIAAPAAGLDEGLIRRARANALEVAFLGEEEKAVLSKRKP